jgi:actin-like ATPase involved in cell morphogenesis
MNPTVLIQYVRDTHNLLIGEMTAATTITALISMPPVVCDRVEFMTIRGRNLISGFPTGVEMTRFELRKVLSLPQAPETASDSD